MSHEPTQTEKVLCYLREHGSITPLEALDDLGIMRLGARIWDLQQEGHVINHELVDVTDRHGKSCRVASYRLRGGASVQGPAGSRMSAADQLVEVLKGNEAAERERQVQQELPLGRPWRA